MNEKGIIRNPLLRLGVAGALTLAGCSVQLSRQEDASPISSSDTRTVTLVYDSSLESLRGLGYMQKDDFNGAVESLSVSDSPLLKKIALDLQELQLVDQRPDDFPSIINEASFPLLVFVDPNSDSSHAYRHSNGYEDYESFNMEVLKTGNVLSYPFLRPIDLIISIGEKDQPVYDPLDTGIKLSKEFLSEMIAIRIGQDYSDLDVVEVQSLNGIPITDPDVLDNAGITATMEIQKNPNNIVSLTADILPIMMLSIPIRDLIAEGKLPLQTSSAIAPIYQAANYLFENPKVEDYVRMLNDEWSRSESLTGPEGFAKLLTDKSFRQSMEELHKIIYPYGVDLSR